MTLIDSASVVQAEHRFSDTSAISDSTSESMRMNDGSVQSKSSTPPSASISEVRSGVLCFRIMCQSIQISDARAQSRDELKSDSVSRTLSHPLTLSLFQSSQRVEIAPLPLKSAVDLSPSNTDIDSFELIHALHGHSIAVSSSSSNEPEKRSTSTPSSQVTSSDRYVSYAIHEMGDSSQDRLPAADLPVTPSADERVPVKPIFFAHRPSIREEDITEWDATDNLTSFTDDILLPRLDNPTREQGEQFDASSTDEDVDDAEFEQQDPTNLRDLVQQLQEVPSESYQRFDLDTTPSSNDGSSSSSRQQTDDIYLIPGYPGLWRPTAESAAMNYDADDERRTESKTRVSDRSSAEINASVTLL